MTVSKEYPLPFAPTFDPNREIKFISNATPTVGIELECFINNDQGNLVPYAQKLFDALEDKTFYRKELFQGIIETVSKVSNTIDEAVEDLTSSLKTLDGICQNHNLSLFSTGTHPQASWHQSTIDTSERYQGFIDSMRWPARRLLIAGTHYHVAMSSGEAAIAVMNGISVFMPHILALSASSPLWSSIDTGLESARTKIFEALPTAGSPPTITNWSEFTQLMRTLKQAKAITSINEIWWDIRPHLKYGTLEIRIADGINTKERLKAIGGFIHCLVRYIELSYLHGERIPTLKDWTKTENKWRALRHGLDGLLIRNETGHQLPIREHLLEWLELLTPLSKDLGCEHNISTCKDLAMQPSSAQEQRIWYEASSHQERKNKALDVSLQLSKQFSNSYLAAV